VQQLLRLQGSISSHPWSIDDGCSPQAADASWYSTQCSHHPAGQDQFRILVVLQMAENEFVAEFFNG